MKIIRTTAGKHVSLCENAAHFSAVFHTVVFLLTQSHKNRPIFLDKLCQEVSEAQYLQCTDCTV